jgi:hypothetical protein
MDDGVETHVTNCPLLAKQVDDISDHALKLISTLKISPSKDVPSQPCEQGIMYTPMACQPKDKLPVDQEIPSLQLS